MLIRPLLYIIARKRKGSIELDSVFKIVLSVIMLAGVLIFLLAMKGGFLDGSVASINSTLNKTLI
ncbi:MAG: hypothetical protein K0B02_04945 [DPANN group archaeon]|nr:hypothetical protein [DPANN group archaeon]